MNQAVEMASEVEVMESGKPTFMQRVMRKMGKDEKGFTLIELLAVLIIIAIIAVIAVPLISNIINNSRASADVNTARQVYDAARMYVIGEDNGAFDKAGDIMVSDMQAKGYLEKTLVLPSTKEAIDAESKVTFKNGELDSVLLNKTKYEAADVLKATAPTAAAEKKD